MVVDGWGLCPEDVVEVAGSPDRMVVLVVTAEYQQVQALRVPRARAISAPVSDPELALRNRIVRDRLLTERVAASAARHGVRIIEVDGRLDAREVAGMVAEHFAPYLPDPV